MKRIVALLSVLIALVARAEALVFWSTDDPSFNATAPSGTLEGSGWQWQGQWGGYLGTPIGPRHFLTAKHFGGSVGDAFLLGGTTYTATHIYTDSSTDLRIVEVDHPFASWAPLYRGTNESGMSLVVFGRGVTRGAEVRVGGVLKGWQWGGNAGVLRWGQNTVGQVKDFGPGVGWLIRAAFNAAAGATEAHLAQDSGGGVFLFTAGSWKLAGINFAVDGYFNFTDTGNGFNACIFDAGGLYVGNSGNWQFVEDASYDIPSSFYVTSVSRRLDWIDSVLDADTPETDIPAMSPMARGWTALALVGLGWAGLCPRCRGEPRNLSGRA